MTSRAASLGMYDRPELQDANDLLWSAIAARLVAAGIADVPAALDRSRPLAGIWDDPDLLLAQCCGYPFATAWRGRLRYVATPRYDVAGCEGSSHRSRIVVRHDDEAATLADLRGRRAAINDAMSNTGMNLLRGMIAPMAGGRRFFAGTIETGSHAASARLVASGGADVAAIDAVSFAHLEYYEPAVTRKLRTLGWSRAVPGLPLVTRATATNREIRALRAALAAVEADSGLREVRSSLRLAGFDTLRASRYDAMLRIEARAVAAEYPVIA